MKVKIYDMDGTIVCSLHRYRTMPCGNKIDLQFWRDNEYLAENDILLPLAKEYQEDIKNPDCYVIIATARIIRDADMRFIKNTLGMPNYIISRKENDNQSGASLKIKGLQKFFNLKQFKKESAIFFEDNVSYLKLVCDHFNITGIYIPSNQGH